jgi:integrase/recombinase XerC
MGHMPKKAPEQPTGPTLAEAFSNYLDTVKSARSEHTARAYGNALNLFRAVLVESWLDPQVTPAEKLTEDVVAHYAVYLKNFAPATEHLYLQAVKGFYEYMDSERLAEINLSRVRTLIRQRSRRPGIRLPQFPADDIERVLAYMSKAENLVGDAGEEPQNVKLRAMRDRAFLLTLADTGLRVHEACKLRRGDIDWNEGRAVIIGKGDKQAVVRFSTRSMKPSRNISRFVLSSTAVRENNWPPCPSLHATTKARAKRSSR